MRVVYHNAADRANPPTASSTAGAMSAANLLHPLKSRVWRSQGKTARLGLTWAKPEDISCLALPFCNLSPTAYGRARLTKELTATNLLTFSEAFNDGSWERIGFNLITGVAAPDGTNNAMAMVATSSDPYLNKAVSLTPGTYSFSIFLKATGVAVGKALNVWFWNNGNLGGFSAVADNRALTNGWVRYKATANITTAGSYRVRVDAPDTAANGDTVQIFGAQLESGAMSSYYPAGVAAATRPLGFIDSWQSYDYDSGLVPISPAAAPRVHGLTDVQAASAYSMLGGTYALAWTDLVGAYGADLYIDDQNNLQGYIEAAFLWAGRYWETASGPTAATWGVMDSTTVEYTRAGDQWADGGTMRHKLDIDLTQLPETDRPRMATMLKTSRKHPLLVAVFHNTDDPNKERMYTVLGRRASDSDLSIDYSMTYSMPIPLVEV